VSRFRSETNQPSGYEHRRAGFVFRQLRADTAVRPYAEKLVIRIAV
jgi:hypothetical protein